MNRVKASAVVVTRGDVDLQPIYHSLGVFDEVVTWDNGGLVIRVARNGRTRSVPIDRDLAVYGRYAAMGHCHHKTVYVQDDDCVLPRPSITRLLTAFKATGRGAIVSNLPARFRPHYPDSGLVGFGAVMDARVPEAIFDTFLTQIGDRPLDLDVFLRRCDNVLTTLAEVTVVDVPYVDRPFASDPGRMWTTPGHVGERDAMIALARAVRDELANASAA